MKKNQPAKQKANSKAKGLIKERLVARHLRARGWNILFQNKKILGVEIDLLAQKNGECRLIEVKSIKKAEHLESILKDKQKERLKKALDSLSVDFKYLRLFLAAVNDKREVEFFEIL